MAISHDLLRNGPTRLRTLEPGDADWLLRWENDPVQWAVSGTTIPFSRSVLETLCEGHQDLYTAGQLRWVIEELGKPVGAIDLYDHSNLHQRAGIGILVDAAHRGQGTGGRALSIAIRHAQDILMLKGLHAEVQADNAASIQLFTSCGFEEAGRYSDWTRKTEGWVDAVLFQIILNPGSA